MSITTRKERIAFETVPGPRPVDLPFSMPKLTESVIMAEDVVFETKSLSGSHRLAIESSALASSSSKKWCWRWESNPVDG